MLERLLESRAPVSSLWGLLGDNPKFYYPEYRCENGPVADSLGYHEHSCFVRPSPVMDSWNLQ